MMRLDSYLVQSGCFSGREKAKDAIQSGCVTVNGKVATKASALVENTDAIMVEKNTDSFVGRGGYKLAEALNVFGFSPKGLVAVDLGASTGGFTDCLLQNGAKKVYAVDVGTNQLVSSLRSNPAVVVLEQTNARELTADAFPDAIQLVTADLSFISLSLVFPAISSILVPNGRAICLIKPQFEAGKGNVGKSGIVRDCKVHCRVIQNLITEAENQGLHPFGLTHSPITGGDGNIEFLIGLQKSSESGKIIDVEAVVSSAHEAHRKQGGKRA